MWTPLSLRSFPPTGGISDEMKDSILLGVYMVEYNSDLLLRAKEMRNNMTPQEYRLWFGLLSGYPVRFKRQKVIDNYIADFYCHKARLVIEVDGSQHLNLDAMEYDRIRTLTFNQLDLTVLRFSNLEVDNNFTFVCETINQAIRERLSLSSEIPPVGGKERSEQGGS